MVIILSGKFAGKNYMYINGQHLPIL